MPKVRRSREIAADPPRVWDLVSDPHNMPRWWPKVTRVEDVRGSGGERTRWTAVLATQRGRGVRADYRCTATTSEERYEFEQDVVGTPFERVLKASRVELKLRPSATGTTVTIAGDESLRGFARLGGTMLRGAAKRRLDDALAGIENALVGPDG